MIARISQIWVEKETGNYVVLREFLGDKWIGDYYYGPIMDPKIFQVKQENFIKRILIYQPDLFEQWRLM